MPIYPTPLQSNASANHRVTQDNAMQTNASAAGNDAARPTNLTQVLTPQAAGMRLAADQNPLQLVTPENSNALASRVFSPASFLDKVTDEHQFTAAMEALHAHLCRATPETRAQTMQALTDAQHALGESAFMDKYHFRFPGPDSLMAGGIEFKSVFSSEEWSKVMVAGIQASPEAIKDKNIVDVGCGNFCFGTISKKLGAKSADGVDINPDAILNAKINQVLLFGAETDTVQTSDLLSKVIESGKKVDTVIACIPQIINFEATQETLDSDEIAKSSLADRERHSHQTAPVGGHLAQFDVFGLGLVARLLEQAPQVLAPHGQILLNVAGRPGEAVIQKLFDQFDLSAEPVVTKVFAQQYTGDDTVDLHSWVKLEETHNVTFEFYKDPQCVEKLSARQAQGVLETGQPVYHSLTCYRLSQRSGQNA